MSLIDSLIEEGWLKTPRIIEAFRAIKRVDFMLENMGDLAELNEALPIGQGQTISQPLVVAFMLEQLNPQPGEKILDIGSGSGWTTALLAHIVSRYLDKKYTGATRVNYGKVIAIEVIPELKEFGEKNVSKYNFIKKGIVEFICADGSKGCQKEAPYDKILCSAAIYPVKSSRSEVFAKGEQFNRVKDEVPGDWKSQLKVGGIIVTPIASSIWKLIKKSEKEFEETEYPGFVFVPLVTEKNQ